MVIDIKKPGTPGWWMHRLATRLDAEWDRFAELDRYGNGRPQLAWPAQNSESKFGQFQMASYTNFASLIVEAPCERIGLRSVSTAADNDVDGDAEAWQMLLHNDFDVQFARAARWAFKFSRAYLTTGMPAESEKYATLTAENPRTFIAEHDPLRPSRVIAAFKIYHDPLRELDVAILWLPGEKHIAVKAHQGRVEARERTNGRLGKPVEPRIRFDATSFTLRGLEHPDGLVSETYEARTIPVDVIENRDGIGEYELHTDLLDRLNHAIFILLVLMTLQAFNQRALEQSTDPNVEQMPEYDKNGKKIDYSNVFEAGPDALWVLPPGVKVWQSVQAQLDGVLNAIKADTLRLSAVTRTPMSMFTPDAATQTAEGAQLQREGLDAKVAAFNRSAGRALARRIAQGFEFMGDTERADVAKIEVHFLPVTNYTLAEMGSASSQAVTVLPPEVIMDRIWQMNPSDIARARSLRTAEALRTAATHNTQQAPNPPPDQPAPQQPQVNRAAVNDAPAA